ncbi:MAG: 5'/3'-nucleotidase SurE [Alphaproteobacteria bacterium]|nr:5'/3'-nucleotidase SurE [Alphaproteobacteria bacterium]
MFEAPLQLDGARILLSNDDGINAPGLEALEAIARTLSDDIWVVAPETEQSGAGHSLTLHEPIRLNQHGERRYSVTGSPTDAVLLGISHVLADHPPDLLLSGVNRGGNLGEDVTYSGTVAAAMEATLLDVPSIALSQVYTDPKAVPFETAVDCAPDIIRELVQRPWPKDMLFNVNFPAVAPDEVRGVRFVRQGRRKLGYRLTERTDPRGRGYFWIGTPRAGSTGTPAWDSDIAVTEAGSVAVTPINLDMTDVEALADWAVAHQIPGTRRGA